MIKQVVRVGALKDVIASAVRSGDLLTLSGQVSVADDGKIVGMGDIAAQVRQAYENIQAALAAADASMDDIVDEMWLVTDIADVMANMETVWPIREAAYGKDPEVSQTMVQVASLVYPELLIEIKCIARL